ncbi:hypothetical protein IGI04_035763 [Brassica rapa subsp. trilocularis]|uniref:Secreted protein n=1 Tax=Brassica rapa subsp. trilocularis TaxID=1813537 RepID=A0ABQ7LCQ1_BRACM|nr:hypothetical protein IGI04_035763 [Brassica rapa subsp. trilocularis]
MICFCLLLFFLEGVSTSTCSSSYSHWVGVYFAESLNRLLRKNWKSFSTQNYFDPHGVFVSVLINTLFSLCYLIVKWKRAELRHRARLARSKQE